MGEKDKMVNENYKKARGVWKKLFPPRVGDLIQVKHDFLPIYQDAEILEVEETKEEVFVQWRVLGTNKWLKAYVSYS